MAGSGPCGEEYSSRTSVPALACLAVTGSPTPRGHSITAPDRASHLPGGVGPGRAGGPAGSPAPPSLGSHPTWGGRPQGPPPGAPPPPATPPPAHHPPPA